MAGHLIVRRRVWSWRLRVGLLGGRAVQLLTQRSQLPAVARAEETVVAHFDEAPSAGSGQALGEHVLQEAADEFFGRRGAEPGAAGVGEAVTECHFAVFQFEDAVVADGDAEDVGGEILEGVEAIANRLAMHHPLLLPYG